MQSEVLVVVIISISRRFGKTSVKFITDYMTPYPEEGRLHTPSSLQ